MPPASIPAGLCERCRHQRLVPNSRGSVFSLCQRSRTDPAYPRYPRLPVQTCAGYEPRPGGDREGPEARGGPHPGGASRR